MNEIKKMFCPNCGGPVRFQPGREDTFCSHCGSQLYFKDDKLEVKLKHEEAMMAHEEKMAEEERKKKDQEWGLKFVTYLWIIIGILIVTAWVALFMINK